MYFGFYGSTPGQLDAVHGFTNLVWTSPWRGRDGQIDDLQQAQSRGLPCILDLTWLLWSGRDYVGSAQARSQLREYFGQLKSLDLLRTVVALYAVDEPDLNLNNAVADTLTANRDVRVVLVEMAAELPIAVIYGNQGTPGIESFDWIGRDDYERGGAQTLPLLPHQRLMIIAGGADKYRQQPDAFEAFANSHQEVVAFIAFIYDDYTDPGGAFRLGINHNGLLPAYRAAGCRITGKCTP